MTIPASPPPSGVIEKVNIAIQHDGDASRYGFQVLAESSRTEGDWTYLVIDPTKRNGLRAYEFASILGRVEAEVRKSVQETKVILLPASGTVNP
ncbi:MAG: hypothetical protein KF691_02490 [Phycisphaeraceae bacterium]|nr:hypothetical protein [Phycisphaeraceae bacterium]